MVPNGIWRARMFCEIAIASSSEARAEPTKTMNEQHRTATVMAKRFAVMLTSLVNNKLGDYYDVVTRAITIQAFRRLVSIVGTRSFGE